VDDILLKYNRVGMIAPFNFLIPVSGALLSAIFLGENILELKYAVALALLGHLVGKQGRQEKRLTPKAG
jgi:drug/metabolite transporter (DMT)-like permease